MVQMKLVYSSVYVVFQFLIIIIKFIWLIYTDLFAQRIRWGLFN